MRRAIMNVGVGYWYPHGSDRLRESIATVGVPERGSVDWHFWTSERPDEWPAGCPPHTHTNYGFKVWALRKAEQLGYDQAVWIDSSCWAIRPLDPIWATLDERGYYLEPDGANLGRWISDVALEALGLTRDQVWDWPLPEGKLIGLDFRNVHARSWLMQLEHRLSLFSGPWTNDGLQASQDVRCRGHRHDIALGAVAARSLSMVMREEKLVGFPEDGQEPTEHVVLLSQGMSTW